MNSLSSVVFVASVVALLCGCDNRPDRTLSPPPGAQWVTVRFRVPEGITLRPAEALYRSERCQSVRYDSRDEPYDIPGYNDTERPFVPQGDGRVRTLRVAVDGGGSCQWQLKSLKVSFSIADDNPLVKGKEVFDTSYIFDFGDYGLSDGYGTGRAKAVSGDLDLKTDFFPMIFINHMFKKTTLELFGGDTDYKKWSRRYRLSNTSIINISPLVHLNKPVRLESPEPPPGDIMAYYPDGRHGKIPHIYPDYDKLLSMK
ncbi:hypothetical protein [Enterobacter kobei]|uniref:hypothetical protein n=1 Tax=Enterobacter kobei TaxID=208224 RepID=UPI003CF52330